MFFGFFGGPVRVRAAAEFKYKRAAIMEEPEGLITPHFGVGGGPLLPVKVKALPPFFILSGILDLAENEPLLLLLSRANPFVGKAA